MQEYRIILRLKVINVLISLFLLLSFMGCKQVKADVNLNLELKTALEERNKPLFKKILEAGADANIIFDDGYWIIGEASKQRDIDFLKLAIEYGGDVNLKNKHRGHITPMYEAVLGGNLASIDLLLDSGADMSIRDCPKCPSGEGQSALSQAAYYGDFRSAYRLFEHKEMLDDDEIRAIVSVIENTNTPNYKDNEKYKLKFIEYLRAQGHQVDPNKEAECHNDLACKEKKKYLQKIDVCEELYNNPNPNLTEDQLKKFIGKCDENMPIYKKKAGQ